jgi:hypothetical protein
VTRRERGISAYARIFGVPEADLPAISRGKMDHWGAWQTASTLLPSGSRTKAPK